MKKLALTLIALTLVACGMEPRQDTSCSGTLDGVEFTYSYQSIKNKQVRVRCSQDDATSGALFEFADRAEATDNNCILSSDYVIQWTGGSTAVVHTNPNWDLRLRELVGEIQCQ